MRGLPPSVKPSTFTLSATTIGFLLIDNLTSTELDAIGNWLMLVAQILQTYGSQMDLLEERKQKNHDEEKEESHLKETITKIQDELEKLKKDS